MKNTVRYSLIGSFMLLALIVTAMMAFSTSYLSDAGNLLGWTRISNLNATKASIRNLNTTQFVTTDPYVDVRAYGAKCDKATDDSAAIQTAINALSAGQVLVFPSSECHICKLNITKSNITLLGTGQTILTARDSCNGPMINITGTGVRNVVIKNFWMNGNWKKQTSGSAIWIYTNTSYVDSEHLLEDITINNVKEYGVFISGLSKTGVVHINRVKVKYANASGFYLGGADHQVHESVATKCYDNGFWIYGGNMVLQNCKAFDNGNKTKYSAGFKIGGARAQLTNCESESNMHSGYYIGPGSTTDAVFTNCIADRNGMSGNGYRDGYTIDNADHISIVGGYIMNRNSPYYQQNGINAFNYTENLTVTGVVFRWNNYSDMNISSWTSAYTYTLGNTITPKVNRINGDLYLTRGKGINFNQSQTTTHLYQTSKGILNITLPTAFGINEYDDIILTTSNLRPGATAPSFTNFMHGIYGFSFTNAASNEVFGAFEVPHDYAEGTNLMVHVHWSPSSTNTGDCVWVMEYAIAAMNSTFTEVNITATTQLAGSGTINKHQYTPIGTISGTGLKIGTVIAFRLSRPTGDSFTGDAFLHSVGIHYQKNTLGSKKVASKW